MNKWFWFQNYDRSSSGIVPAKDLEEVYKLAGSQEIRVWEADWDGQEFRKGRLLKKRARMEGQLGLGAKEIRGVGKFTRKGKPSLNLQ